MANLKGLTVAPHYLTFNALRGNQFGKEVISMQCTAEQVLKFIEIDREVQRDVIEQHVTDIQKYIQFGLDGNNIYFPPLIFSSRGKGKFTDDGYKYHLNLDDKLIVLDGQHRIIAFEMVIKRLETREDANSKQKLHTAKNFPLTLQIFTDLSIQQEQQLFTDVNTKASKVSNTLLVMYKQNNPCAELAKEIIANHHSISEDKFEVRSKTTRTKLMTAATLHNLIITLNEGVFYTAMTTGRLAEGNIQKYRKNTEEFLNLLVKYAPKNALNRQQYIVFIPSVLFGIALFIHHARKKNPPLSMERLFDTVIKKVDWSHRNKDFRTLGIPYKQTTKRYNFSNGARGSTIIAGFLEKELGEVGFNG
ncbi:DNA sulfur modification protein DndB [Bacillus sp. OV166]|uniref:DNA sulfur modification protein DndB n=1 Tax=Bacillus sp. OV166 TaxID=1882763 RepID=UPI000A2ADC08|nr:DNA sulfur modification protein DndB [Bacillus sp. OV166]SMQ60969.1 DNA sulfur modification protein DndB [Bacillus sp. OV166]